MAGEWNLKGSPWSRKTRSTWRPAKHGSVKISESLAAVFRYFDNIFRWLESLFAEDFRESIFGFIVSDNHSQFRKRVIQR